MAPLGQELHTPQSRVFKRTMLDSFMTPPLRDEINVVIH